MHHPGALGARGVISVSFTIVIGRVCMYVDVYVCVYVCTYKNLHK